MMGPCGGTAGRRIEALFLDVDGTLVSFRTHRIPASAIAALHAAHGRGVRIFIATGRAASDLDVLAGIPYDGVAAFNGSECLLRDGRTIARHGIPEEEFERALELAARYDFPVALELEGEGIVVDRVTPVVRELAALVAHPIPPEADLRAVFARGGCCQMCFYIDEETERRVMPELPRLAANRWCPIFTDVNVRGVDKATGMACFAAHFGFPPDRTMAFGDGGNDVPMLRAAGVGVALGEACDEAKRAADYVTAPVDGDGVRRALEYFGIIGK